MSDYLAARNGSGNYGAVYDSAYFFSRTEAHWAAFFDRVNWDWRYRPVYRNGWTPDFALGRDTDRSVPCIVVPADLGNLENVVELRLVLPKPFQDRLDRALRGIGNGTFLVLGAGPFTDGERFTSSIGWHMSSPHWHRRYTGSVRLGVDKHSGQLDFVLGGPPYIGAVTGRSYDTGNGRVSPYVFFDDDLKPIWRSAVEAVPVPGRLPVQNGDEA
jgi:hypothetical protein